MSVKVIVIVKDSEKTLKTETMVYNDFTMSADDPEIGRLVAQALKNFGGEPTDVQIKTQMTL